MSTHTPTPWHFSAGVIWVGGRNPADPDEQNFRPIGAGLASATDSEFAVRAVNAHDALVSALDRLHLIADHDEDCALRDIGTNYPCDCGVSEAVEAAKAALLLAREEKRP